jgi:hypothetical protein
VTAKQVLEQLLAGKKVGLTSSFYMYLNIEGNLMLESDGRCEDEELMIGNLIRSNLCRIIPEEG